MHTARISGNLLTNLPHSAVAQANRYRDDAENMFDQLKNQWGWGATQDSKQS